MVTCSPSSTKSASIGIFTDVEGFWQGEAVELAIAVSCVGSDAAVQNPLVGLHQRQNLVFCEPIDAVASLTPDEAISLLSNSGVELLLSGDELTLGELIIKDLAWKGLVDAAIDKIVSGAVLQLLCQINFHGQVERLLTDESAGLSNNSDFLSVGELSFEQLVNLGGNNVEVV